ncbi:hypothetical protein PYW08_012862 [Mythimna loreyi]|uniref:Uncharacterized protein n=1 Tax=Mythimna loreyi TaxID=667449 RepID=A0ACC2Q384_9NEOP|nr:hypothetical protein PYW08_012862 [Mythimna loreyi]
MVNTVHETSVWSLFTKKDLERCTATCNACQREFIYKGSISNLRKHWKRKHGNYVKSKLSDLSESDRYNSDNSDGEQEKTKKPKATWSYFEVADSDKFEATCKVCEKLVPFTSSADLTQHIKEEHDEKHKDSDEEYVVNAADIMSDDDDTSFRQRRFKSSLWKFFTPTSNKFAVCLLCKKLFNYRSTITNLRRHLRRKHQGARTPSPEDRQKVFRVSEDGTLYEIETVTGQENKDYDNDEDPMATDTVYLNEEELNFTEPEQSTPNPNKKRKLENEGEELHKVTDVWRYFDTDSGKKAQCVVCKAVLVKDYDELKSHLRDNHPNLLLEILQDQPSDNSDAGSNNGNEDNENTYTEIVYLEQEPTEPVRKHKEKKSLPKPFKKRERQPSTHSSEDIPLKKPKKEEENDELTTFIKYITCLLKKLPSEVFTNVQMEIINTILKANNEAKANTSQSIVFNKELPRTAAVDKLAAQPSKVKLTTSTPAA